jgi:hypothetical protein
MTRAEFVQKYTHEVSGPVMDVLFRDAKGGELSMLVRRMMQQIDRAFGAAYDELSPPAQKIPNPPPQRAAAVVKTNGNGAAH